MDANSNQCKFILKNGKCTCEQCGTSIEGDCNKIYQNCSSNSETVEKRYPSIFQMGINALTAGVNYVASGFENASEEERNRRLDICRGCSQYDKSQNRCYKCGCGLGLAISLQSKHCPDGLW